jgi:hypothetical protein
LAFYFCYAYAACLKDYEAFGGCFVGFRQLAFSPKKSCEKAWGDVSGFSKLSKPFPS